MEKDGKWREIVLHPSIVLAQERRRKIGPRLQAFGIHLVHIDPDARDIYDGFELSDTPTPYMASWGHPAPLVKAIAHEPNRYLPLL